MFFILGYVLFFASYIMGSIQDVEVFYTPDIDKVILLHYDYKIDGNVMDMLQKDIQVPHKEYILVKYNQFNKHKVCSAIERWAKYNLNNEDHDVCFLRYDEDFDFPNLSYALYVEDVERLISNNEICHMDLLDKTCIYTLDIECPGVNRIA